MTAPLIMFPMPMYAESLVVLGIVRGEVADYYYCLDTDGTLVMENVDHIRILRPATPFDFKEKPRAMGMGGVAVPSGILAG